MEEIKINCRWTSQPLEVLKHCTGEHLAHIKSNIWCFLLCTGTGWKAKYTTPDYIYYVLHVPFTCSACSSYMLYMFLLHVLHVPFTCSACSKVMFNMYLLHVQYVQSTCSTCTFYMFSMFKGHVLHVPFACSSMSFYIYTQNFSEPYLTQIFTDSHDFYLSEFALLRPRCTYCLRRDSVNFFIQQFLAVRSSWAPITSSFLHIIA